MKLYKLSLVAALVGGLLLACGSASAQDTKEGKKKGQFSPQARVEQMAKDLNLTDAQKAKLTPVFEEQGKKMRAMREDTNLSQEQRQEKMREMRTESDKQIKAILTPEQWEKWQKDRPQFGKKGEGKQGEGKKKE